MQMSYVHLPRAARNARATPAPRNDCQTIFRIYLGPLIVSALREEGLGAPMNHLHQNAPFLMRRYVASKPERIPALRQAQGRLSAQEASPCIVLA
jgi:hypothetical protein